MRRRADAQRAQQRDRHAEHEQQPKPRTIGTGESSSTSIAAALAAPAVAIVGAPGGGRAIAPLASTGAAPGASSSSCTRDWNWIA